MAKRKSKPGAIHHRIVEVLKRFPEGASNGQVRQQLQKEGLLPEEQAYLDKRQRELTRWFDIEKKPVIQIINGKKRLVTLYKVLGEKSHITDEGEISQKLRAEVIHAAHGQCQMCGRTIEKHKITLVVDHKTPRNWGGTNDRENLWAICEGCNGGKKAFFDSLDPEIMKKAITYESVHVRIGELLKAVGVDKRTPSAYLEVVAGNQDDWQKRLRELRYPVIGWEIDKHMYKATSGKKQADYILRSYKEWPKDPTGDIRRYEREREKRNRAKSAKH